jgi:hypothetical protein
VPKKKLFNGSNYVGAPVCDETYRALWMVAVHKGVSIADIVRSVLNAWSKSPHAAIPQDKISVVETKVNEILAQRNSKKSK